MYYYYYIKRMLQILVCKIAGHNDILWGETGQVDSIGRFTQLEFVYECTCCKRQKTIECQIAEFSVKEK